MKSCKEYDYLPYHYSWDRHCGGSWMEFTTRSITLTDSILLAYAGAQLARAGKLFGVSIGTTLISKSTNDMYEAWTGKKGIARETVGDPAYDLFGYGLMLFGLLKQVPKMNYLGNPMRDFFIKDPISYEHAFKQYSRLELFHLSLSTSITTSNDIDKYLTLNQIELDWNIHLSTLVQDDQ
jgi:hypothetical protein